MSQGHPIISLLHPTARVRPSEGFPHGWHDAYRVWFERADHPENIEYVLSVHSSRWEDFCDSEHAQVGIAAFDEVDLSTTRRFARFLATENKQRDCVVDQINNCALSSSGKLLCGVQDDVIPPEHWDTLMLEALPTTGYATSEGRSESFPHLDGEYLLHFSSGSPRDKDLIVAGAMTWKRYERYGYILDPDFESMKADDWLTFQARRDEEAGLLKIITRLDIEFTHNHPIFGKGAMDEVYALQNREQAYRQGTVTFMKKAHGTKSLAVCMPGEVFRSEVFWNRISLLLHINGGLRFFVAPVGHHSSNVYHTRIAMTRSVLELIPDIDYVFWLDDDQSCTAEQFEMLYQDLQEHPELSGVFGWTWCDHKGEDVNEDGSPNPWMMSAGRQGSWEDGLPAWNFTLQELAQWEREGKTLITSDDLAPDGLWCGFPVVLLRGDCVRELGPLGFQPLMHPKMIDGFTGEDASFVYRARAAEMKFAVDLRVESNHCKLRALKPPRLSRSGIDAYVSSNWPPDGAEVPSQLESSAAD